jgi:hypothetical protein
VFGEGRGGLEVIQELVGKAMEQVSVWQYLFSFQNKGSKGA